jgi:hypothetical protein
MAGVKNWRLDILAGVGPFWNLMFAPVSESLWLGHFFNYHRLPKASMEQVPFLYLL